MKFTCEKVRLVSAISVASRTVAQKSAIPALEGILLKAGEFKVMLTGYNRASPSVGTPTSPSRARASCPRGCSLTSSASCRTIR